MYNIDITLAGERLPGSPFKIAVDVDPALANAIGPEGLEALNKSNLFFFLFSFHLRKKGTVPLTK